MPSNVFTFIVRVKVKKTDGPYVERDEIEEAK